MSPGSRARYQDEDSGPWISIEAAVSSTPVEEPTEEPTPEPTEEPTEEPTKKPADDERDNRGDDDDPESAKSHHDTVTFDESSYTFIYHENRLTTSGLSPVVSANHEDGLSIVYTMDAHDLFIISRGGTISPKRFPNYEVDGARHELNVTATASNGDSASIGVLILVVDAPDQGTLEFDPAPLTYGVRTTAVINDEDRNEGPPTPVEPGPPQRRPGQPAITGPGPPPHVR